MNRRWNLPDALRGVAVLGMFLHHFFFDYTVFIQRNPAALERPALVLLQTASAGLFILLAGLSSSLTKNPFKRSAKLALWAGVLTQVSYFLPVEPIRFGILHFLALMALLFSQWDFKVSPKGALGLILLFVFLRFFFPLPVERGDFLTAVAGFPAFTFRSGDYFPLLPWGVLYPAGRGLGPLLLRRSRPFPLLEFLGRHSLILYFVHQPLFYLILLPFMS